jgi:hypothetical protein
MSAHEYIIPLSHGVPQRVQWYRVDKDFPGVKVRVMVWGGGTTRFGYRDKRGNWRGLHHGHMNAAPKYWAEIPKPEGME